MNTEIAMCTWARNRGWMLVYDPEVVVDHHVAPRLGPARTRPDRRDSFDAAYNLVASLLAGDRRLLVRRGVYGLLVGDRGTPGLLRAVVAVVQRDPDVVRVLGPSVAGQGAALIDALRGRRIFLVPMRNGARMGSHA
jgi:hypothetical protein